MGRIKVPTQTCHSLSRMIIDSMFQTTSDKLAWVAAAGGASAPALADYMHGINSAAVWIGPPLAAIFVASKTVLVWLQIAKERKSKSDTDDHPPHHE